MARSITDIQNQIRTTYVNNMALIGITINPGNWSATSLEKLLLDTVAFCIWVLESLFDSFRTEVDTTIAAMKPHSTRWYAEKARAFRYGYDLIPESDQYDDTGLTEDEIAASKVIQFCAVVEQDVDVNRFGLRIKVATLSDDELTEVPTPQLDAFEEYMSRIKDAGVSILITTGPADSLRLNLQVYYNPLVLNNQGQRLDGTDPEPVQNAINNYLKNLPFNGVFVLAYLTDVLQQVDGVVIPHIIEASARYGSLPYSGFAVEYLPDSGYLRIINPSDLTIQWIARSVI